MSSMEKPADENNEISIEEGKPVASRLPTIEVGHHPQNNKSDILANVFIRTRGNGDDFTINEALSQIDIKQTSKIKNEAWFEDMEIEKAIYSAINGQNCKFTLLQLKLLRFQCVSSSMDSKEVGRISPSVEVL